MNKIDIDRELAELIMRFKRLKKAIDEEDSLSPAQRAAAKVAETLRKTDPETAQANKLAKMLQSQGMPGLDYGKRIQLQPTDEELFGRLVPDPAVVEKAEKNWGNAINNWMQEACKPISSRFKTPEEERAYWDSIKVHDTGGNDSGY